MAAPRFLVERFHEYYSKRFISGPPQTPKREFGAGFEPGQKISQRHLGFKSEAEFNDFLRNEVPFYVSYSSAYYELPAARPMEAKKMQGSDLIYEFDADDIPTNCKESHDTWKCAQCEAGGKGGPKKCPQCGSGTKVEEWVCPECINAAKAQTFRILDFLENDFGFSQKEISVNYSGSKGFHIHVRSENAKQLNAKARIEMFDYLIANGLDLESIGFHLIGEKSADDDKLHKMLCPLEAKSFGWAKRISHTLKDYFSNASNEDIMKATDLSEKKVGELLNERRATILEHMSKEIGNSGQGTLLPLSKENAKKSKEWWGKLIDLAIEKNRVKSDLDRQTSIDINKIIRVPSTLHGSTGLVARIIPAEKLKEFDALRQCIAFSGKETKIEMVSGTPKFYVGGEWFGPFAESENVSVPEYCAVYLIARGDAK
ncbi:MAG: DNA primase small subunit domain-containing protein [archaeon]